jgi:F0F1-type ATP synthase assembly protein I
MPYTRPIPKQKNGKKFDSGMKTLVEAEKLTQIAFTLPSAALVGWFLGSQLDRFLHTRWLTLVGIFFGGFSGLYYVVRLVIATKPSTGGKGPAEGQAPTDAAEIREDNHAKEDKER